MFSNQSVNNNRFAMIPSAEIPRSKFVAQKSHKTTFDSGYLIPVYCDEVLPGDTFNVSMTAFARLSTPLFPIMDNLIMDSFFFFVPNRLIWDNWKRFMGERPNPSDSVSFLVPHTVSPVGGYDVNSLQDYMGLPTKGQIGTANTFQHCSFWPRAYNLIWNEWFRDENLQDMVTVNKTDGPDPYIDYKLLRRGKRHDYFTSALPWPQKGESVSMPLGQYANITYVGDAVNVDKLRVFDHNATGSLNDTVRPLSVTGSNITLGPSDTSNLSGALIADLTNASAATINQLRTSFQVQKLLERDARGGTRYTEIVRSHFGVMSPDARLQRPEYLGGGSTPINISPITQSSATAVTGSDTPLGHLGAMGTGLSRGNGFTASFTEHGVILGMVSVRADINYQQGLNRMWSRKTRLDFYFPAFANLGEQSILNKEIYCDGSANDDKIFGYQERWAEYRYKPSQITGLFRSTAAGTLDGWHLAQRFQNLPTLNATFIQDTPPLQRILAVGDKAGGQEFIFDAFFNCVMARPLPMYSVPGLIDHF